MLGALAQELFRWVGGLPEVVRESAPAGGRKTGASRWTQFPTPKWVTDSASRTWGAKIASGKWPRIGCRKTVWKLVLAGAVAGEARGGGCEGGAAQ